MNAKEIVKALRCSGNENAQCKTCKYAVPYKDLVGLEGHLDYCDDDDLQRDAADLIESMQAQLTASQRRERAAVEDMLKVLLSQLEKEKDIISNEHGKDYAHLNFADGRRHTLMRVEAWAKTQIKNGAAAQAGEGGTDG